MAGKLTPLRSCDGVLAPSQARSSAQPVNNSLVETSLWSGREGGGEFDLCDFVVAHFNASCACLGDKLEENRA